MFTFEAKVMLYSKGADYTSRWTAPLLLSLHDKWNRLKKSCQHAAVIAKGTI